MSIFDWTTGIKILFDRPIITEVEAITGTAYRKNISGVMSASGYYSSYYPERAFDNDTITEWYDRTTTGWFKLDYGRLMRIGKIRVYAGESYRPKAFTVQGCDDNATWQTVHSGEFTNTTGWKEYEFNPATYRYWRLNITTAWSSRLMVHELELYEVIDTYNVAGWTVSANEPDMSPGGTVTSKNYTIRRLTRAESNYAIIIWLELTDRMKHPQGDVTVTFSGTLQGAGGAFVAPFSLSFTPQNIIPYFNPHTIETILLSNAKTIADRRKVSYIENSNYDELAIAIINTKAVAVRTHIDDIIT